MVSGQSRGRFSWLIVPLLVIIVVVGSAYASANQSPREYTPDTAYTLKSDWSLFGNGVQQDGINHLVIHRLEPLPNKPSYPAPMKAEDQEAQIKFGDLWYGNCRSTSPIFEVPSDTRLCDLLGVDTIAIDLPAIG